MYILLVHNLSIVTHFILYQNRRRSTEKFNDNGTLFKKKPFSLDFNFLEQYNTCIK